MYQLPGPQLDRHEQYDGTVYWQNRIRHLPLCRAARCVFIPAILLLNYFLGLTGVQVAQAVADLLTLVCAIPIHIYVLKTMEPLKTNTL
jgi:hypothetical protein